MKSFFKLPVLALMPKRCACCGRVIDANSGMCRECQRSASRISGEICKNCGREKQVCSCKKATNYYNGLTAPFYFEGVVRVGIHRLKFRKSPRNAEAFACEMANAVRKHFKEVSFDFITEIPISKKSLRERGYNQGALLARGISENTGIEYREKIVVKLYETEKQHGLTYYLRKGNLTGVYDVVSPEDVNGKTVLLCDDVSTSGETFNEAAKMLWLYGAKEVYCVATAVTKPSKSIK